MATTATTIQTPISVLEADMPAGHIISFQFLLHLCRTEQRNQISGSQRALARLLHAAKTTFPNMIPQWVNAGWVTFAKVGKHITLTLTHLWQPVPELTTEEEEILTSDGPSLPESVPDLAANGPIWDENGPFADANQAVITNNITDITSQLNISNESNDPPIIYHDVPELTTELALELFSRVSPVPKRPKSGAALESWLQRYYDPMADLIAMQRPLTGPFAWAEIDLGGRYMACDESGWRKSGRGLPTPENLRNNWDIQVKQIASRCWQPEERTPYPGCGVPNRDTEELTPVSGMRDATPMPLDDLVPYAQMLMERNPYMHVAYDPLPDGVSGILLAQFGPEEYFPFDPWIWHDPTPEEDALIDQAIAYGQSLLANVQRQSSRELAMV